MSTTTTKAKAIPAAKVFAEARKRPGYEEAYEALEGEFSLAAELIRARVKAGLTQDQVASRMSTTQPVIARMESGGRLPSTRSLERFARATGHRLKISFIPLRDRSARHPR